MAVSILRSVGSGGNNKAHDVSRIQALLNKWLDPKMVVSGTCDGTQTDPTVKAIKTFQSTFTKTPDGRVDPGGGTPRRLNADPLVLLPQMSGFGYYSYGSGGWYDRQWGSPTLLEHFRTSLVSSSKSTRLFPSE